VTYAVDRGYEVFDSIHYQAAWLDTYIPIGILFVYFGGLSLVSYFATYYLFFPIQAREAVRQRKIRRQLQSKLMKLKGGPGEISASCCTY
jgi:hypothetical protein